MDGSSDDLACFGDQSDVSRGSGPHVDFLFQPYRAPLLHDTLRVYHGKRVKVGDLGYMVRRMGSCGSVVIIRSAGVGIARRRCSVTGCLPETDVTAGSCPLFP